MTAVLLIDLSLQLADGTSASESLSSSEENEEDEALSIVNHQSDEEDLSEEGVYERSSSEDSAQAGDSDPSDDEDVFGPVTASGRKRKIGVRGTASGKGGTAAKRRRGGLSGSARPILKPSAATVRKMAARAARQQQRLAERQARRLKPRLPFVQQRHIGLGPDGRPLGSFEKARAVLHVGCTPDYLPCRDGEYAEIEAYLEDAIDEGVGSCICM